MLEKLGLLVLVERIDVDVSTGVNYQENQVIDQSIEVGEAVESGTSITLYIPNVTVSYPDFTNGEYSLEDVLAFADTYGIEVEIIYEATSDVISGTIINQSRPVGQRVVAGQSFTITIAESSTEGNNGKVENCESGLF